MTEHTSNFVAASWTRPPFRLLVRPARHGRRSWWWAIVVPRGDGVPRNACAVSDMPETDGSLSITTEDGRHWNVIAARPARRVAAVPARRVPFETRRVRLRGPRVFADVAACVSDRPAQD